MKNRHLGLRRVLSAMAFGLASLLGTVAIGQNVFWVSSPPVQGYLYTDQMARDIVAAAARGDDIRVITGELLDAAGNPLRYTWEPISAVRIVARDSATNEILAIHVDMDTAVQSVPNPAIFTGSYRDPMHQERILEVTVGGDNVQARYRDLGLSGREVNNLTFNVTIHDFKGRVGQDLEIFATGQYEQERYHNDAGTGWRRERIYGDIEVRLVEERLWDQTSQTFQVEGYWVEYTRYPKARYVNADDGTSHEGLGLHTGPYDSEFRRDN